MSDKTTIKKKKKTNPNLRLIKNGDVEEPKKKRRLRKHGERSEKIRFGKTKRSLILLTVFLSLFLVLGGGYFYIINNYKVLSIGKDQVTVQNGANVYKAGVGELFTGEGINFNTVSNLESKFGGRKNSANK